MCVCAFAFLAENADSREVSRPALHVPGRSVPESTLFRRTHQVVPLPACRAYRAALLYLSGMLLHTSKSRARTRSREVRKKLAVGVGGVCARIGTPDVARQRGIFDRLTREIRLSTFDTRRRDDGQCDVRRSVRQTLKATLSKIVDVNSLTLPSEQVLLIRRVWAEMTKGLSRVNNRSECRNLDQRNGLLLEICRSFEVIKACLLGSR